MELIIGLVAIIAGIVQGVTGFGAGIVLMMALPMFYAIPQSAGIAAAISILLSGMMVYSYRQYIDFKKVIKPAILYIIVCSITINFSTLVNQDVMKKVFGVFLIILCIYYLFINKSNERKKLSIGVSIACIVISALCDGLFGIGGPLMVLYFLSQTHNTHQYLGSIQAFFCINATYNTIFRIFKGILLPSHLLIIICGIIGIILGGIIANKLVDYLDEKLVRKLTYIMIGISGIMNII